MTRPVERCPNCDTPLDRDEVDIGVGTMYGPPYCSGCGWAPPDDPRIPQPREYRASGDAICSTCGKKYIDHPLGGEPGWTGDGGEPKPFLHQLCNGDLVKL